MRGSRIKQDNSRVLIYKEHTSRDHFTFRDLFNGGIVHSASTVITPSCRIPLGIRAIPRPMTNLLAIEARAVIRGSLGTSLTCGTSWESNGEGFANSCLHI